MGLIREMQLHFYWLMYDMGQTAINAETSKRSSASLESFSLVEDPFTEGFDEMQNVNYVIAVTMFDVRAI